MNANVKGCGTISGYRRGCHCDSCRAANALRARQSRGVRMCVDCGVEIPRGSRARRCDGCAHGLYSTYRNKGCRCDPCRAAHAEYVRARRNSRAAGEAIGSPVHGKASTYENWRCRCDLCRDAMRSRDRRLRARREVSV